MSDPPGPVKRGQPLLALVLIVGGWCAMRVLLWQAPFDISRPDALLVPPPVPNAKILRADRDPAPRKLRPPRFAPQAVTLAVTPLRAFARGQSRAAVNTRAPGSAPAQRAGQPPPFGAAFPRVDPSSETAAYFPPDDRGRAPAALGPEPLPSRMAAWPTTDSRWTGDSWLLLRNGSSGPIAAAEPSYGRSQAGAVLRYRLAASSAHRPVAYVRATRALSGPREGEVAAGFAARPLAGVPVRVAGELRVSEGAAGRELRPAGFAVTELPPVKLPLGVLAEVYAEAGYVGGRYATAFIDGQARLDRRVASLGSSAELSAGGGAWGGAQKHAGRLDIGPSAVISFRLGEAQARLALDYRVRVSGHAAPKSGPAMTISAGF